MQTGSETDGEGRGSSSSSSSAAKLGAKRPLCKAADADKLFSAGVLLDLAGSTSAEVRRMTDDERALVHFKRRLRNRESAKRSRARRQATINDLQAELGDLRDLTTSLVERCVRLARETDKQGADICTLRKEKALLESLLRSGALTPAPP